MKLSVYFFALIISLSSCQNQQIQSKQSTVEIRANYLALGDSYTIGESVKLSESFPYQLRAYLNRKDILVEEPKIIAKTGWRTDDLITALKGSELKTKYDLVSLLIGVNNQYQNKPIKQFKTELEALIKQAISLSEYSEQGVVLISIPDYGVTPFAAKKNHSKIGKEIDQYNQIIKSMASDYKLEFYYITNISRKANENSSLLAEDQLHPSGEMYGLWVEEFGPLIENKIRRLKSK